ncbi:hypothetical protein ACLILW_07810 [Shewanella baltica]|uniref:hypothetical protein n=1 Tax=Shewanella baltica TaxID=62322 RepID=UPI003984A59C
MAVLCSDVFCHVAAILEHIFAASLCVSQSVAGALSGFAKVAESGCGLLAKDAFIPDRFA